MALSAEGRFFYLSLPGQFGNPFKLGLFCFPPSLRLQRLFFLRRRSQV